MIPSEAARVARIAHANQMYGLKPYIEHVRDVVLRVVEDERSTTDAIVVAFLHDVIEDSSLTIHDLKLTNAQRAAVLLLTRGATQPYEAYIDHICTNPLAALVKYHDVRANLEAWHKSHSIKRRKKYSEALPKLREALIGVTKCWKCGAPIVFLRSGSGFVAVNRGSLPKSFDLDVLRFSPALGHELHAATCEAEQRFVP